MNQMNASPAVEDATGPIVINPKPKTFKKKKSPVATGSKKKNNNRPNINLLK